MARIGLVPGRISRSSRLAATLVADAISKTTGLAGDAFVAREPRELVERYAAGYIDIVWASPTLFLQSPQLEAAAPIAVSVREGSPHYHSVFFVRRDSPFRSPLDLRGKSVAWVASTSASGYILPRMALADMGVHADELFKRQVFGGTHGNVAHMVRTGEVACGAGYAHFTDGDLTQGVRAASYSESCDGTDMRVLLASPPIPSDLFLAHPSAAEKCDVFEAIETARLASPEPFAQLFGIDGFARPDANALTQLRRSLDAARSLGVLGPV